MKLSHDYSKVKAVLESENPEIRVPIDRLVLTKSELKAAAENISRGYFAMTEGPVLLADMGRGLFQLIDGYHRVLEAMLVGSQVVVGRLDLSLSKRPWALPKRSDRFRYDSSLPYKGLENFLEPYMLRRL